MGPNQDEIEKIIKRSLTNETSQVNDFIKDLKAAGASPGASISILTKKLGINLWECKELVFNSPSWKHLYSGDNPFNEEFMKVIAADADEVKMVDGKIISVKIDFDKDSETKS